MPNQILMSFDLEDVRMSSVDGIQYPSRVEQNTLRFLDFLKTHHLPCTFFTVGHVFKNHSDLVKEIISHGHELAWHSNEHLPVARQSQKEFSNDLEMARKYSDIFNFVMVGYRAPMFSVNESTVWFHQTLEKFNFKYSSSVLPADNPLYGWKSFGTNVRKVDGILEIPMSLLNLNLLKVPLGGTYLRALPVSIIKFSLKKHLNSPSPVTTYLHPYDLDSEQERYTHGGINNNKFYNWLMYYNRKTSLPKLSELVKIKGFKFLSYGDFYENFEKIL